MTLQVGVVGGVDEVVREWLCHVLIHCLMLRINGWIVFATKKAIVCVHKWKEERERERERERVQVKWPACNVRIHHLAT